MRIAIIIERADIALGGAERSVFELTASLSSLGVQVDLLAAKGKAANENIHVLCRRTRGKRTGLKAFGKTIKKHLAANHYDIIHSVLPFSFADVYQPRGGCYAESVTRNAASYANKLVSAYKNATAFANPRRAVLLKAERALCKEKNGPTIAALSEYVKEQFKNHYNLTGNRVVVIPGGIKTTKIIDAKAAAKLREQILLRLGVRESSSPMLFLFVANNFRLKGLTALIKAMQVVSSAETERPAYLIITGRDNPAKYRKLAKKLGVSDRIAFIGRVRHIHNVLAVANVAVLPTYYDPCSRFVLEALSAVKPVITTRFNGAADFLVDNRHGCIFDSPENIPALAAAITHFTDSVNVQKSSRAIVEDKLREKISITKHAEKLITLYQSIMQNRSKQ